MVRLMLREDARGSRGRTDRWPSRRQPSLKEGGAPSYDTDDRAEDERYVSLNPEAQRSERTDKETPKFCCRTEEEGTVS